MLRGEAEITGNPESDRPSLDGKAGLDAAEFFGNRVLSGVDCLHALNHAKQGRLLE